ncbi:MAG: ATP-dependent endonuclease [Dehalococcoidia bacterium]|nr:ATP-dependent endonuclease [Dehalococcoidia bacterium]
MIIEQLEIKNFRCIKEEGLKCGDLTAILGRNGSGKSAFLHALAVFYNLKATVSIEDFFNHDTNNTIEIRVTYGHLRDDEKEVFKLYIKDEKLVVTKRISYEDGYAVQQYYGATLQLPKFAEIRSLPTKTEIKKAWNELVDQPGTFIGLGTKARSVDAAMSSMSEYETKHPELLKTIEQKHEFFGSRNIGGGKLDNFTKFVLIPAVKDASDEVSGRKSSINQILDAIVVRKIESRKDIQEFKVKVSTEAKKLYCSDNLTELPALGESISNTLEIFAPGSKLKLDWQEFEMPDIPVPEAIATLIEDNFEGEIGHKGHGLQRALVFTLLQHLALMVHEDIGEKEEEENEMEEKEEAEEGTETQASTTAQFVAPDLILSIEEPELYLHPSRCRYMRDVLYQLAEKSGKGINAKNQIIYTTHSPFLLNLDRFETIRLIRKKASEKCHVPHSIVTSYSFSQMAVELAKICDAKPGDFTGDSVKARVTSVMNTIVNEGFFADVVVIVEGISDIGVLWKLQELLGKNWAELGIVIVPAGGKNKIGHPTLIFKGLSIQTYFIFDADVHVKGKGKEKDTITRNRQYLRLAGSSEEDFPKTQVHENWAVFGDNLECELRAAIGPDHYETIRGKVADELGYSESDMAMKNIEGAAKFIEYVYEKGMKIPVLEDIILKVTDLRVF